MARTRQPAVLAAAPNGTPPTLKKGVQSDNASALGHSSEIIQNGQWISGHNPLADTGNPNTDQTSAPGMRAALVQELLGH